jgi:hypothetical protein
MNGEDAPLPTLLTNRAVRSTACTAELSGSVFKPLLRSLN